MLNSMNIQIKRAYEDPAPSDGARYLVDRLWPRGRKREDLDLADWLKDLAPSNELRKWFGHEPALWDEFRRRYFAELAQKTAVWQPLLQAARQAPVTLIYGSKETQYNNAVALKEFLEQQDAA